MQGKVKMGVSSFTGYGVSALALAAAIVAYTQGDRSEQTLGTITAAAVAVIAFAITQIGRYVQAKVLAQHGAQKDADELADWIHGLAKHLGSLETWKNAASEDLERFGRQLRDLLEPADVAYSEATPSGEIVGSSSKNNVVNTAGVVSGLAPAGTVGESYDPDLADDEGPGDGLAPDLLGEPDALPTDAEYAPPEHEDKGDGIESPAYVFPRDGMVR